MKQARFYKVIIPSLIIVLIGLVGSLVFLTIQTRAFWFSRHSAMLRPSVKDLIDFAFSKSMNSAVWIGTAAIFGGFLLIAVFVFAMFFNEELTVTENGIVGRATFGKEIDYTFDRITSVKRGAFKKVVVKTKGQENVVFGLVKNQSEIIEAISDNIEKQTKYN